MVRTVFVILLFLVIFLLSIPVQSEDSSWLGYQLTRFNFHTHTNISATPLVEYKDYMDFDHGLCVSPVRTIEMAYGFGFNVGLSDHCIKLTIAEWNELGEAVKRANSMGIVAFRGFEWTPSDYNHINVFNSEKHIAFFDVGGENLTIVRDQKTFNAWLAKQSDLTFAQFNHPTMRGMHFDSKIITGRDRSIKDQMLFFSPAYEKFCLMEVGSGPEGFYSGIPNNLPEFIRANSDSDLFIAPSIGGDNVTYPTHSMRIKHTAIWADDYSFLGVTRAILARRVYASEDEDVVVKYSLHVKKPFSSEQAKIYPMGSRMQLNSEDIVTTDIEVIDPTDRGRPRVDAIQINRDGTSKICYTTNLEQKNPRAFDFGISELKKLRCIFLLITQPDGDQIVTAPIWIGLYDNGYSSFDMPQKAYSPGDFERGISEFSIHDSSFCEANDEKIELRIDTFGSFCEFDKDSNIPTSCHVTNYVRNYHPFVYLYLNIKLPPGYTAKYNYQLYPYERCNDSTIPSGGIESFGVSYRYFHHYCLKIPTGNFQPGIYHFWVKVFDASGQELPLSEYEPEMIKFNIH